MMISGNQVTEMFRQITAVMEAHSKELCEMDAKLGDGDLGLTMKKGFGALPTLIRENLDECSPEMSLGNCIIKSAMRLLSIVPSTMGTLMASGLMGAGRALEKEGIPMAEADIAMIPQNYLTLTDEQALKNLSRTLDLLEDDDDVQNVYTNLAEA